MPAVPLATTILFSLQGRRARHLAPTAVGAMAAATPILTAALTPLYDVSLLRVTVVLSVASRFQAIITPSGAAAVTADAEQGTALVADALYSWVIPVTTGSTYNFQALLAATVRLFSIEELEASQ